MIIGFAAGVLTTVFAFAAFVAYAVYRGSKSRSCPSRTPSRFCFYAWREKD